MVRSSKILNNVDVIWYLVKRNMIHGKSEFV